MPELDDKIVKAIKNSRMKACWGVNIETNNAKIRLHNELLNQIILNWSFIYGENVTVSREGTTHRSR